VVFSSPIPDFSIPECWCVDPSAPRGQEGGRRKRGRRGCRRREKWASSSVPLLPRGAGRQGLGNSPCSIAPLPALGSCVSWYGAFLDLLRSCCLGGVGSCCPAGLVDSSIAACMLMVGIFFSFLFLNEIDDPGIL
jgi:hypothetical protein